MNGIARAASLLLLLLALPACGGGDDSSSSSGGGGGGGGGGHAGSGGDGQEGATLTYSASGHPQNWLTDDATVLSFEDQVVDLVNQYRAANGLGPLTVDLTLRRCARGHSRHLRSDSHGFWDSVPNPHTNPEGDDPEERLTLNSAGVTYLAENLAAGYATPAAVLAGWQASPGHNANLLTPGATLTGVGYQPGAAGDSYASYWTQLFAQ